MSSPIQVSSRGCSRAFVVFALYRGLEHVQRLHTLNESIQFPFAPEFINAWFVAAHKDCQEASTLAYQSTLGGTLYAEDDSTTYWTSPQQYFTW